MLLTLIERNGFNMTHQISYDYGNPYNEWARIVLRTTPRKQAIRLLKWWKSRSAKQVWGTKIARLKRQALRQQLFSDEN